MPTYKVVEKRMVTVEYEIEADSSESAKVLDGNILGEYEIYNCAHELVSCEAIDD